VTRLLAPPRRDVTSRKWAWYANSLAASQLLRAHERARLYRWLGMELASDRVKPGCFFQSARFTLGTGSSLNYNCFVENVESVVIGARTDIGYCVRIFTSTHGLGPHEQRAGKWWPYLVRIGDGCWIGAGATILPGVTVGDGCVVAAGAVVTEDCAPDGLYAGVPARRIRELDDIEHGST
jgi:maltose O-acetyltransferase